MTNDSERPGIEVEFFVDHALLWTYLGANWEALTGIGPARVLKKPLSDSLHGDDRAPCITTLRRILRGEFQSSRFPVRFLRHDGRFLWIEVLAHPRFDASGTIDGISGTLMDITDRRKGMRALRESEARFRAISETSPLGVCVTDSIGQVIYANSVLRTMADSAAIPDADFALDATVVEEDRRRFRTSMQGAQATKSPFQSEHRYRHRDGAVVWCRLHAAPILDADQLLGYVYVAEDVTAARLGEQALRRSQERLQLALEGSGVALMDVDLRTSEVFLSEQWWTRFIGEDLGPMEMTLERFISCVHDDDQDRLQLAIRETLSGKRPYLRLDYRILTANGQWKWIETHARVVERSDSGDPLRLTGTHADITERKDLERLQAEFVATVSHELRTPLTSVLGALEVVQESAGHLLDADANKFLSVAHKSSERLFNLVNDILDLEKVERGLQSFLFAPVALKPLFEQTVDLHDALARRHEVSLLIDCPEETLDVWSDSERLMQVLTNLISNAIKFSPAGGRVTLSATSRAQRVRIEVSDQGAGIPAEFQARVFQRFSQADRRGGRSAGSGLGLSICKALVEKMEGQIGFRSDQRSGTTFFVELPKAGRAQTAQTQGSSTMTSEY